MDLDFDLDFSITPYESSSRKRMQETYRRKYNALKRKCDLIELSNERVLNRLCHVKKYIHRLSRERRGLTKKLTELGDEFKKTDLTIPLEDDLPTNVLGISESPSSSSLPAMGGGQGGVSPLGAMETEDTPQTLTQLPPPTGHGKSSSKKKRSRDVNKSEKEKDPNAPKKPANAFLMYCQQERQKVQDGEGKGIYPAALSHQDLTRQLAKQWKYLSEEAKKHYYTMYEKEKDRYDKAVKKYAKAGGEKRSAKKEEDAESETIDVVKMGQDADVGKKEIKEVKVTMKSSGNEDQNVDVEKDEFEFTDFPIVVDEPKICLEKIDKSKLFDKARLFGLSSPEHKMPKYESGSKGVPVTDLLLNTSDMKIPARMMPGGMDYRGPSILEITTGAKTTTSTAFSTSLGPGMQMKPSGELTIKELVGMRAGAAFEMQSQPMMDLKPKSPTEDRTVLASALRNKSMFDMKPRFIAEPAPSKPSVDPVTPRADTPENKATSIADARNKSPAEVKSRISVDLKARLDPKPKSVCDSKGKPTSEPKMKPAISEMTRSPSSSEIKVKPSAEFRRMSIENKKPVVELKKLSVDPSDDPYHFDD